MEEVERELADCVVEKKVLKDGRVFLTVKLEKLREAVKTLRERGFQHLIAITGLDARDHLEAIYHIARGGEVLSLRVIVPSEKPEVPTITDIIPGALFYEREVHDLVGITPVGHPDPSPLLLPDDWSGEPPPLRKSTGGGEAK